MDTGEYSFFRRGNNAIKRKEEAMDMNEETLVQVLAHGNAIKAMEVLKRAAETKDAFADEYAELVAGIDGIGGILKDYDNVKGFVGFCLAFRGINAKGKDKRASNRITYVKTQASIALAEKLGIPFPEDKADWQLQAFIDSVKATLEKHEVPLPEFVAKLNG